MAFGKAPAAGYHTEAGPDVAFGLDVDSQIQFLEARSEKAKPLRFQFAAASEAHALLENVIVLEVHLPFEDEIGGPGSVSFEDYESCVAADVLARSMLCSDTLPSIPGAISVHPSFFEAGPPDVGGHRYYPRYEKPEDGNLMPMEELQKTIARYLGITCGCAVLVYGRGQVPMMTSARVAWALLHAGVAGDGGFVYLLDGGFPAWVAYAWDKAQQVGEEALDGQSEPKSVSSFFDSGSRPLKNDSAIIFGSGLQGGHRPVLATTEDVQQSVGNVCSSVRCPRVVDIRRLNEHTGDNDEQYPFFKCGGHIPNSLWQGNWDSFINYRSRVPAPGDDEYVSSAEGAACGVPKFAYGSDEVAAHGLLGMDVSAAATILSNGGVATLRLAETERRWRQLGLLSNSEDQEALIFYCGTGWRSALAMLIAADLGVEALNYDGGFYEWSHYGHEVCRGVSRSRELESDSRRRR